MASFAISRLVFKAKNAVRVYFVMGMMLPIQSIIVPLAFAASQLRLRDNYLILILLYAAFYMPMSIFVLSGFMSNLPTSLEEAAVIDGCSMYGVFLRVVLPLSRPAMATVSIFVFMYCWNDLLTPMVLIGKESMRTVSVGLLNFMGAHNSDYGGLMAAVFIALLPPLLIYIFMQENVVKGITSGANK
jgi:raffinose/stachyose/melibiose transport system permease protein